MMATAHGFLPSGWTSIYLQKKELSVRSAASYASLFQVDQR